MKIAGWSLGLVGGWLLGTVIIAGLPPWTGILSMGVACCAGGIALYERAGK